MDQLVAGDPASAITRVTKIMFLTQLRATTRLQFIACSDIGGVAALVLQNPERYIGKGVDLAGDELSPAELEDGWREVFGEEMRPKMMGGGVLAWAVRVGMRELRLMFKVRFCDFLCSCLTRGRNLVFQRNRLQCRYTCAEGAVSRVEGLEDVSEGGDKAEICHNIISLLGDT
jgi:hypothetical protein